MKKCFIYVTALLMMGGTFTGCLDNDEPAGIEQMRGAKAEFYKAQAAVKNAEVAIKEAEAQYKMAQAQQEQAKAKIAELKLAVKQAESDKEIARLNGEMEVVKEEQAKALLEAQKNTAIAQYNYDLAIKQLGFLKNQINGTYAEMLDEVTEDLKASMDKIVGYKNNIMDEQRKLMIFTAGADSAYVTALLSNEIIVKEQTLASKEKDLEKVKTIVGIPVGEWEAQGEELKAGMAALKLSIDSLNLEIAKLENNKAPWNEKLTETDRKLNEDVRPLEMKVPAAIQDQFVQNVLMNSAFDLLGCYEYADGEYALVGGEQLKIVEYRNIHGEGNLVLTYVNENLPDFLEAVKNMIISPEDYAWETERLKTLKGNMDNQNRLYADALVKWQTAGEKYIAARDAYFIDQNHDVRTKAQEALKTYQDSKKETADKNTLIAVLKDYYTKRMALDSVAPKYLNDMVVNVIKADNLETILTALNEDQLLGDASILGTDGNEDAGACGAFYAACKYLWGENSDGILNRLTPFTEEDFENGDYNPLPASSQEEPFAYWAFKYTSDYEELKNKIDNQDAWNALYNELSALNDHLAQEVKDLNAERRSYAAEVDAIDLAGEMLERKQSDLETSKGVYDRILGVIRDYFNDVNQENPSEAYDEALENLKVLIATKETEVLNANKTLKEAKAALEAWEQGLDTDAVDGGVKAVIAQMESNIEYYQMMLAAEQKQFEAYTAQKDALLEVLLGESYE